MIVEEKVLRYKNIYYFNTIQKIGGIETFFYQLAKKYKDYDLVIVYRNADENQLKRLKKYVRCIQFKNNYKIVCEKAFFNFNTDIIDSIEAEEYCLVIHGNYKWLKGEAPSHPKINKYYAVSKDSCEAFKELTGKDCEVIYNPISKEETKPLLKLVSACRLDDSIKGGNRTKALIKKLDEYSIKNNVNYVWLIFTNPIGVKVDSDNVVIMNPRLDIYNFLNDADYVIQLSDNFEGYNYTINESLLYNTPIVITPCDVYEELGINDSMSIRLEFDMSNIDEVVDKMFKKVGKFKFNYEPPKDGWGEKFVKSKATYQDEIKKKFLVEALSVYEEESITDYDLGRIPRVGEQWVIGYERLEKLLEDNKYNRPFVKVIKEVKD